MARRMTQTFHGFDRRDVIITIPDGDEHAGTYNGQLRAWAVDDETGDWWADVIRMDGMYNYPEWQPAERVRLAELTDYDGLVDPGRVVALHERET